MADTAARARPSRGRDDQAQIFLRPFRAVGTHPAEAGFELVLVHQATFPYIRNDAPRDEQWRVGAALQAVSRNHPETRGNPPFCGTMSRGNERDLAQSLKKRCADKYRSEAPRVGKGCVSKCRSRWARYN